MNTLAMLALALGPLAATACSADSSSLTKVPPTQPDVTAPSPSRSPDGLDSPSPPATPGPSATMLWSYTNANAENPVVRFVAQIDNPGPRTLSGVVTEWIVRDPEGAVIGAFETERPPVPAGKKLVYVGGAGGRQLDGRPASVEISVTDPGSFSDRRPARLFVSDPILGDGRLGMHPEATAEYAVSATVANLSGAPVATDALKLAAIVFDEAGQVIGGGFITDAMIVGDAQPSEIGDRQSFEVRFSSIPATSLDAAYVQVVAYAR